MAQGAFSHLFEDNSAASAGKSDTAETRRGFSHLFESSSSEGTASAADAAQNDSATKPGGVLGYLKQGLDWVKGGLRSTFNVARQYPIMTMCGLLALDVTLFAGAHTNATLMATGTALIGALVQSVVTNNEAQNPGLALRRNYQL